MLRALLALPERSLWDAQGAEMLLRHLPEFGHDPNPPWGAAVPPKAPNPGRVCGGARSSPGTCCSGKWPSGSGLCLPQLHAPRALRGRSASWHGASGIAEFLFPCSSLLQARCPLLPRAGGLPSALGSARLYGRAERGRARTPPECRDNFLELPWRKAPSGLCAWRCQGGSQPPALLPDPPAKGWSWDPLTSPGRI